MGALITPKNRQTFYQKFFNDYLKRVENSGNPDNLNDLELSILAKGYANIEIAREKKHLKAYLKGLTYYKYRGQTLPVLTPVVFSQQEQMQKNAEEEINKHKEEEE